MFELEKVSSLTTCSGRWSLGFHKVKFAEECRNATSVLAHGRVRRASCYHLLVLATVHNGLQDFAVSLVGCDLLTTESVERSIRSKDGTLKVYLGACDGRQEEAANACSEDRVKVGILRYLSVHFGFLVGKAGNGEDHVVLERRVALLDARGSVSGLDFVFLGCLETSKS